MRPQRAEWVISRCAGDVLSMVPLQALTKKSSSKSPAEGPQEEENADDESKRREQKVNLAKG